MIDLFDWTQWIVSGLRADTDLGHIMNVTVAVRQGVCSLDRQVLREMLHVLPGCCAKQTAVYSGLHDAIAGSAGN